MILKTSFENTEMAFATKSDWELKKAYWVFNIINNTIISKVSIFVARLSLKLYLPIRKIIKHTIFSHFCAGESIQESRNTIEVLLKHNVGVILDYSVEGGETEESFDKTLAEIISTIHTAKKEKGVPFCVFKPTGVGLGSLMEKVQLKKTLSQEEKISFENIKERYLLACSTAYNNDVKLLIDAEEYCYQETVDTIVYEMMEKFNTKKAIIFNTYQLYRWASLKNIKEAHKRATEKKFVLGVKIVRGAYMEKERERAKKYGYKDPICSDKKTTDENYNKGLKYCVENIESMELFSGTHNEYSNLYLTRLIEKSGLKKNDSRIFFSQLYGMSDNISFVLAKSGYNVAKYTPYGPIKLVMPYLIRRAEENRSVKGQSHRELTLIKKELKRRKTSAKK